MHSFNLTSGSQSSPCLAVLCISPGDLGMSPGLKVSQLMNIGFDMAAWVRVFSSSALGHESDRYRNLGNFGMSVQRSHLVPPRQNLRRMVYDHEERRYRHRNTFHVVASRSRGLPQHQNCRRGRRGLFTRSVAVYTFLKHTRRPPF